ncbi:DUF4136 domain-containing protein [Pseudomonas sp. LS44]|uniref:DUF4136 domain-containing protein n=1 Tax=Pseudomonas sp. LS44 TaxID=1357074 RepID=UPI00215A858F|nr:DUF4136 domain-containing protein [Pseudomonas sp. LS44]UVE17200.1 DUF4136 domain-containing protein [Pseudomonas sp. LS44]
MKHVIAITLIGLSLAACQSVNPYKSDSAALPPAPPAAATTHDFSAYPAAPIDYAQYRTWSWQTLPNATGTLSAAQLQEMLGNGLEQRGLRQAQPNRPGDLQARANVSIEQRQYQVQDNVGGYYGSGPYWGDRYGGYASVPLIRTYQQEVMVLHVDLFDTRNGQPVWSGSAEATADGDRAKRSDALRQAVRDALANYPPH